MLFSARNVPPNNSTRVSETKTGRWAATFHKDTWPVFIRCLENQRKITFASASFEPSASSHSLSGLSRPSFASASIDAGGSSVIELKPLKPRYVNCVKRSWLLVPRSAETHGWCQAVSSSAVEHAHETHTAQSTCSTCGTCQ